MHEQLPTGYVKYPPGPCAFCGEDSEHLFDSKGTFASRDDSLFCSVGCLVEWIERESREKKESA